MAPFIDNDRRQTRPSDRYSQERHDFSGDDRYCTAP
jgi:hypothetical protein